MSESHRGPGVGVPHHGTFVEIADRCWVARHRLADVNVGVVAGRDGVVLVDTHSSARTARAVLEQVRSLGAGDVVAVVNTHAHWDHVLGNATFAGAFARARLVAHEAAAATLREHPGAVVEAAAAETDVTGTTVVVPQETFSSARVVDLGDRIVELLHPGRGHTDGDAVVHVPDARVLYAGDLVEESAESGAVPGFGEDCYPLEWPASLDLLAGLLQDGSLVVPGHGVPVDKEFVADQRAAIGLVAETVRDLAGRGVRPEQMAEAAQWPYPAEELSHAFTRGFTQLAPSGRGLPLL